MSKNTNPGQTNHRGDQQWMIEWAGRRGVESKDQRAMSPSVHGLCPRCREVDTSAVVTPIYCRRCLPVCLSHARFVILQQERLLWHIYRGLGPSYTTITAITNFVTNHRVTQRFTIYLHWGGVSAGRGMGEVSMAPSAYDVSQPLAAPPLRCRHFADSNY